MKVSGGKGVPRPMEVWSADVSFDGRDGSKDRPVVVLGRRGDSFDVFACTTHPHGDAVMRPMDPYDAGLDSRTYISFDRVRRIPAARFNYLIGELSRDDAELVRAKHSHARAEP